MTISEKKIELVQALLLLQDKATLFEIEKLISDAFKVQKTGVTPSPVTDKVPESYEVWSAQFDVQGTTSHKDEFGITSAVLRQRIWEAEQGEEMSLAEFFERSVRR